MQGKEREKNYSLETICSQLELCRFGLETKLETPNPVPPPPSIYLFSTHFKINILTSLSKMPPCYELIGYNIPQLHAWKLRFSPLNAKTTSGGKIITAACPRPLGAAGGAGGERGLRGHPRVSRQRRRAAGGRSVLCVQITPGKSPQLGEGENGTFPDSPCELFYRAFRPTAQQVSIKKHIQYLVSIDFSKIAKRLTGISSEVSFLGNTGRTGTFFIPT